MRVGKNKENKVFLYISLIFNGGSYLFKSVKTYVKYSLRLSRKRIEKYFRTNLCIVKTRTSV